MIRQFMEDSHSYLSGIENPTPKEKELLTQLNLCYDMFPIKSVTPEDLETKGFKIEEIDKCEIKELADKMADDYSEQLFWESMGVIADDLDLPRHKHCPRCKEFKNYSDEGDGNFVCNECGKRWKEDIEEDDE